MKKIISTTLVFGFFLFANSLFAQEISKEQMLAFQSDKVESFKTAFSKEDYDKCFAVKENSYSLLSYSIKYERKNIFNHLLNSGVDINKSCDNQTPLMVAARYGKVELGKALIKKGANKNTKNNSGETAKDFSAKYKHPEFAAVLK
ncbi:ankyrin repeat domain-containing protein [Chryseobacterium oryctis]|uniref:Ankyrin repeat domain-containing protein n=1 Tax=Chryseobacterium oryctis TaxID=2952618 RepID=A0ABT3HKF2_9FLAO|nr:ankyrin repeat domain-containing protein [Chryseobacterium oryctis]MCW3160259.1 ankyrin repeat domain-containing protein [Chryseobacterium oryctis]